MDTKIFDLPIAARLRVQSRSGRVHVIAEGRDDVHVETDRPEAFFDEAAQVLTVRSSRGGSKPITVRCPIDTDVEVGTQSAAVRLEGKLGAVAVSTMSGGIDVQESDESDLRSMSGTISLGTCHGRCRVNNVSGSVTGGAADDLHASTVSGSIKFERVLGEVRARTVSGSVEFEATGAAPIAVKTVSGKVRITLPEGTEPQTVFKTHGRVRCDLTPGRDCRIDATSLSGSIEIIPA